MKKIKNM